MTSDVLRASRLERGRRECVCRRSRTLRCGLVLAGRPTFGMVFLHWRVWRTDKVETFVDRCVLVLKKKRNNRIEQELISKEHVYWPREQFTKKNGIGF